MNEMREQRKAIAQETLAILKQGFFTAPSGRRVDISAAIKKSEGGSYLLTPDDGKKLTAKIKPIGGNNRPSYVVNNASTVAAIFDESKNNTAVAALNFASARSPGGGFLNGSMAQEEALAYSGGLYNTLIRHMGYYETNRECKTMMYTNHAIYSPDVVFFRDAAFNLTERPATCSILTLPAVNMGQVRAKGEDVELAKRSMKDRMRLALSIFAHEKNDTIILGAYGCGVFGNDPNDVARWWKDLLDGEGYGSFFQMVQFVILDKPGGENMRAFERVFNDR